MTAPYRGRPLGGGEIVVVLDDDWSAGNPPAFQNHFQHALLADLPRHLRNASNLDAARFGATTHERTVRRLPLRGAAFAVRLPADRSTVDLDGIPAPFVAFVHRVTLRKKKTFSATVEWSIWDNRAGALIAYGRADLSDPGPDVRDAADSLVADIAREMIRGGPFFPGARM